MLILVHIREMTLNFLDRWSTWPFNNRLFSNPLKFVQTDSELQIKTLKCYLLNVCIVNFVSNIRVSRTRHTSGTHSRHIQNVFLHNPWWETEIKGWFQRWIIDFLLHFCRWAVTVFMYILSYLLFLLLSLASLFYFCYYWFKAWDKRDTTYLDRI